jgi:hypothetical protein
MSQRGTIDTTPQELDSSTKNTKVGKKEEKYPCRWISPRPNPGVDEPPSSQAPLVRPSAYFLNVP